MSKIWHLPLTEGKKTKNLKQLLLIAILKKWKKFLKNDFLVDKKNVSKKKYFKTNTRKKNGLTAPGKMSDKEKDKIID